MNISAHFSTMLRIAQSSSTFPRLSHRRNFQKKSPPLGQMTTLQKANGEIRRIVAGNVIRKLVVKTIAKQLMTKFRRLPPTSNTHSRHETRCASDDRPGPKLHSALKSTVLELSTLCRGLRMIAFCQPKTVSFLSLTLFILLSDDKKKIQ